MTIEIAPWPEGKDAACIFMIDDLANICFSPPAGDIKIGDDWGAANTLKNGVWDFLKTNIIDEFEYIKFTFFLVTGIREVQVLGEYPFCNDCNQNQEFVSFLNFLESKGHEIAYHGTTHGKIIDNKFIQEWSAFKSLNESIEVINKGKKLFSNAMKKDPVGGKYCGYEGGKYGHKSLISSGFKWWFDNWDENLDKRPRGEWIDGVLYLPSNIDCSHYSWCRFDKLAQKKYYTSQFKALKEGSFHTKIKKLIKNNGIVSLQEHTSPTRTDGKVQYPNIIDDINNIQDILNFLQSFKVWYATATDVYKYLDLTRSFTLDAVSDKKWILSTKSKQKIKSNRFSEEQLWLKFEQNSYKGIMINNTYYPIDKENSNSIMITVSLGKEYIIEVI